MKICDRCNTVLDDMNEGFQGTFPESYKSEAVPKENRKTKLETSHIVKAIINPKTVEFCYECSEDLEFIIDNFIHYRNIHLTNTRAIKEKEIKAID